MLEFQSVEDDDQVAKPLGCSKLQGRDDGSDNSKNDSCASVVGKWLAYKVALFCL